MGEVALAQDEAAGGDGAREPGTRAREGGGVGIYAEHLAVRGRAIQQQGGVAGAAERAVYVAATGLGREAIQRLGRQDGNMDGCGGRDSRAAGVWLRYEVVRVQCSVRTPNPPAPQPLRGKGETELSERQGKVAEVFASQLVEVGLPALAAPDLEAVAGADDHGLAIEPGVLAQLGRDDDAALGVQLDLEGGGEELALDGVALAGVRDVVQRLGLALPGVHGVDREARVHATGEHRAALDLHADAGRDGDPAFGVYVMEVFTDEHVGGLPTLPHFAPHR